MNVDEYRNDKQFQLACERDELDREFALNELAAGRLVFLSSSVSARKENYKAILVGTKARRKVTALLGLGPREEDLEIVMSTLPVILTAGPDAIMDLTTNDKGNLIRGILKRDTDLPVGACITYDILTDFKRPFTGQEIGERVSAALETGIDFALVHVGIDRRARETMAKTTRVMPTTSRGGGLVARYMDVHGTENPFIEFFDDICAAFREYRSVLDLGDIFRPGCLHDAGDEEKEQELELLASYRTRAMELGVQVLCESGGHMPLDRIPELTMRYKEILGGAPLWLSGPVPLDIGVTLDDVVNAIGVSVAAQYGGDMFCSITHNEHYAMPTAPDTAAGVRATRIAIAAAEVARRRPSAVEQNRKMGEARRLNSWTDQAEHALFPDLAHQAFLQNDLLTDGKPCTVCGQFCPLIVVSKNQEVVFETRNRARQKRADKQGASD